MNENIINDVFSVYEILKDSIKVTRRSINSNSSNSNSLKIYNQTLFLGEKRELILEKIDNVETELDDIMILSLFASFERELRISIQIIIDNNTNKINSLLIRTLSLVKDSIERWTVPDMIDSFKDVVSSDIRNKTKQIYEYRNWVAHGKNQTKLPSIRTDPKTVKITLCDFIEQANTAF